MCLLTMLQIIRRGEMLCVQVYDRLALLPRERRINDTESHGSTAKSSETTRRTGDLRNCTGQYGKIPNDGFPCPRIVLKQAGRQRTRAQFKDFVVTSERGVPVHYRRVRPHGRSRSGSRRWLQGARAHAAARLLLRPRQPRHMNIRHAVR